VTTVEADSRLRQGRIATLGSLAVAWMTGLTAPAIVVVLERRPLWIVLGAIGVTVFAATSAGSLYATTTPWLRDRTRRRLLIAFGAACVLSVPLIAPVGGPGWESWAWVGGAIAGFAPVLVPARMAAAISAVVLAVAIGVAIVAGGSVWAYLVITVSVGVGIAAMSGLPVWLWSLLVQARAGRAAQARLAVTEERLRFARDVHDLLGHRLAVIALKAELAARLAPSDAERAAEEATEVQRLAASALNEVREAVHGYRAVDLSDQLAAVTRLLRSSGVRCTVSQTGAEPPAEAATQLALLLREASTNVLRHSRAKWCTIEISRDDSEVRMTVSNDGANGAGPDRNSFGLRGAAERLADFGGALHTKEVDGVFTLSVTLPVAP